MPKTNNKVEKKFINIVADYFKSLTHEVKVEPIPLKENEYRCAQCRMVYEKQWSDEESEAEASEIFGDIEGWRDHAVVICDDCFNQIHPLDNPNAVKKAIEETKKS